jgi:hypothetical protein
MKTSTRCTLRQSTGPGLVRWLPEMAHTSVITPRTQTFVSPVCWSSSPEVAKPSSRNRDKSACATFIGLHLTMLEVSCYGTTKRG